MEQPKCSNQELWTMQDPDQLEHIKKGPDAVFFTLQPDYSASDVHSSLTSLAVTVLFLAVMIAILIISASSVKERKHKDVCVDFAS